MPLAAEAPLLLLLLLLLVFFADGDDLVSGGGATIGIAFDSRGGGFIIPLEGETAGIAGTGVPLLMLLDLLLLGNSTILRFPTIYLHILFVFFFVVIKSFEGIDSQLYLVTQEILIEQTQRSFLAL